MGLSYTAAELLLRLPHRHPFVLLDGVESVDPGVAGIGLKNITISDPVFAGHFPGQPIYPGVLMIEAAGQTCGIIATASTDPDTDASIGYLATVKRFTFKELVLPGDQLLIHCRRHVSIGSLIEFKCVINVGKKTVAEGKPGHQPRPWSGTAMIVIREYVPDTDSAALAEHFRRSSYGPHHGSAKLGRSSMEAVISERVPELFMVAADDANIVGCIGFMRGSGRRVSRDGELFAGLFVLDPRHRNSMLAGNLFMKSFELLVDRGIRALRIEATPTNTKAYPLYLRAGFRAIPDLRADEDGYVELVSHLPGVVGDLLRSNIDEATAVMPKFNWRNAGSGRSLTPSTGVRDTESGPAISYDLSAGEFRLRAEIDLMTGATLDYDVLAGAISHLPKHGGLDSTTNARPRSTHDLGNGIRAEVDTHGTLRIHIEGTLGPVLIDHWPVVRGSTPAGWRRPHPNEIHVDIHDHGWILTADRPGGTISRRIEISPGHVSVTTQVTGAPKGAELVASPWVAMRQAEKYVESSDGAWTGGPAVRGIWPLDYTDFEACADSDPQTGAVSRSLWRNSVATLEATWDADAFARHEGNHLPQLRQQADKALHYDITIERREDKYPVPEVFTGPAGISAEKIRRPRRAIPPSPEPGAVPTWNPSKRFGVDVIEAGTQTMSLRYSHTAAGLIGWSDDRSQFLSSPYPAVRAWGSLPDWSAGLWAAVATIRENPEQGVEWAGKSAALPLTTNALSADQPVSWTIHSRNDDSMGIDLHGHAGSTLEPAELGFYLTPAVSTGAPVVIGQSGGGKWVVEATTKPWSVGCTSVAAELQDGRYLVIRSVEGEHQEIFVRSEARGLHMSLLTRISAARPDSEWRLEVAEHRSAALMAMER
ncbi:3-hydroxyacyl-ACP dehydratase FabZ [Arthrobacter sp. NA-172]|uniref:3-hydroxyacyl-ACP dehydratase FabZ n=1 Tax=Arthrobacter sp. NA-172 TaxID=3367524 RepID=UPI003755146D